MLAQPSYCNQIIIVDEKGNTSITPNALDIEAKLVSSIKAATDRESSLSPKLSGEKQDQLNYNDSKNQDSYPAGRLRYSNSVNGSYDTDQSFEFVITNSTYQSESTELCVDDDSDTIRFSSSLSSSSLNSKIEPKWNSHTKSNLVNDIQNVGDDNQKVGTDQYVEQPLINKECDDTSEKCIEKVGHRLNEKYLEMEVHDAEICDVDNNCNYDRENNETIMKNAEVVEAVEEFEQNSSTLPTAQVAVKIGVKFLKKGQSLQLPLKEGLKLHELMEMNERVTSDVSKDDFIRKISENDSRLLNVGVGERSAIGNQNCYQAIVSKIRKENRRPEQDTLSSDESSPETPIWSDSSSFSTRKMRDRRSRRKESARTLGRFALPTRSSELKKQQPNFLLRAFRCTSLSDRLAASSHRFYAPRRSLRQKRVATKQLITRCPRLPPIPTHALGPAKMNDTSRIVHQKASEIISRVMGTSKQIIDAGKKDFNDTDETKYEHKFDPVMLSNKSFRQEEKHGAKDSVNQYLSSLSASLRQKCRDAVIRGRKLGRQLGEKEVEKIRNPSSESIDYVLPTPPPEIDLLGQLDRLMDMKKAKLKELRRENNSLIRMSGISNDRVEARTMSSSRLRQNQRSAICQRTKPFSTNYLEREKNVLQKQRLKNSPFPLQYMMQKTTGFQSNCCTDRGIESEMQNTSCSPPENKNRSNSLSTKIEKRGRQTTPNTSQNKSRSTISESHRCRCRSKSGTFDSRNITRKPKLPRQPVYIGSISSPWATYQKSQPEQFWISHLRDPRPFKIPEEYEKPREVSSSANRYPSKHEGSNDKKRPHSREKCKRSKKAKPKINDEAEEIFTPEKHSTAKELSDKQIDAYTGNRGNTAADLAYYFQPEQEEVLNLPPIYRSVNYSAPRGNNFASLYQQKSQPLYTTCDSRWSSNLNEHYYINSPSTSNYVIQKNDNSEPKCLNSLYKGDKGCAETKKEKEPQASFTYPISATINSAIAHSPPNNSEPKQQYYVNSYAYEPKISPEDVRCSNYNTCKGSANTKAQVVVDKAIFGRSPSRVASLPVHAQTMASLADSSMTRACPISKIPLLEPRNEHDQGEKLTTEQQKLGKSFEEAKVVNTINWNLHNSNNNQRALDAHSSSISRPEIDFPSATRFEVTSKTLEPTPLKQRAFTSQNNKDEGSVVLNRCISASINNDEGNHRTWKGPQTSIEKPRLQNIRTRLPLRTDPIPITLKNGMEKPNARGMGTSGNPEVNKQAVYADYSTLQLRSSLKKSSKSPVSSLDGIASLVKSPNRFSTSSSMTSLSPHIKTSLPSFCDMIESSVQPTNRHPNQIPPVIKNKPTYTEEAGTEISRENKECPSKTTGCLEIIKKSRTAWTSKSPIRLDKNKTNKSFDAQKRETTSEEHPIKMKWGTPRPPEAGRKIVINEKTPVAQKWAEMNFSEMNRLTSMMNRTVSCTDPLDHYRTYTMEYPSHLKGQTPVLVAQQPHKTKSNQSQDFEKTSFSSNMKFSQWIPPNYCTMLNQPYLMSLDSSPKDLSLPYSLNQLALHNQNIFGRHTAQLSQNSSLLRPPQYPYADLPTYYGKSVKQ